MIVLAAEAVPVVAMHAEQGIAGLQLWDGRRLRMAIIWTDALAAVAAVDGRAELVAHVLCEWPAVLDSLIGEAGAGGER